MNVTPARRSVASLIEQYFWPKGSRRDVWMVVDAARDPRIFGLLLECFYSQHFCLFSGPLAPQLEVAAPYLVQLDYDDPKTQRFLKQAFGNNWGIFLKCDSRTDTLRRHLREFLIVLDKTGTQLVFRYYDPRVFRVYLPTCTRDELSTVFGPVECFWMENESSQSLLEFRLNRMNLDSRTLPLGAESGGPFPSVEQRKS